MRRRAATFVIAGAAVALIAGCGNSDAPIEPLTTESTTSTATNLSQQDFIVSADARCGEANVAIANLTSGTTASESTVSQELEITQGVLDGLQGIGIGEDPDGSLQDFYAALEDQVKILKQQQTAVAAGDTATVATLDTELDAARSDAETAAQAYGFEECGQPGTALPGSTTVTPGSTTPTPATPAPVPTTPAPVAPTPGPVTPPPTGGTGGGTVTPPPAGGSGGSSGGISPG